MTRLEEASRCSGGVTAEGVLHEGRISLILVERRVADGRQMASVLLRGGRIGRAELSLDPSDASNAFLDEYSASADMYLADMITGVEYDPAASTIAAEEVVKHPFAFGLHPAEVL
jgi:hypothetical protein